MLKTIGTCVVSALLAYTDAAVTQNGRPLPIAPGEVLTVAILPSGEMRPLHREASTDALDPGSVLADHRERPPGPSEIRFRLGALAGQPNMLLVVENGYPGRLTYRAGIFRKGSARLEPTSVCQVLPGTAGFEHWPYRFDGIVITAASIDGDAGTDIACR